MRKAIFVALLLVLGSAVLGATVLREPIAWAATTPFQNVIVTNTPNQPVPVAGTVKIEGTSTVQVTAELEPYEHSDFFNQGPDTCTQFVCHVRFPAVPAGKQLVITYASARWTLTAGGIGPSARLGINGNISINDPEILLPAPAPIGPDNYIASGPVTYYVDAGDQPTLSLGGQFVIPSSNTAFASVVGYLVDAS